MSELPLADAGLSPSSGAVYAAETLSKTWEAAPPSPNNTERFEIAAAPPGGEFEIAVDLHSTPASFIGEDARVTQLRDIYTLLRVKAQESRGSGTRISEETLCFLPGILRTVIQFVQEIQSQNARLREGQEFLQAQRRQMEAHISSLRAENKMFQDEIDVLKSDYASTKAQKDSLEEQLNEIKTRAASDRRTEDSSNKRRRQGQSSSNGSH